MPIIYDNIEKKLLEDGLKRALAGARRADFCVGFFNLRGWRQVSPIIEQLPGENASCPPCRLIVGMTKDPGEILRRYYNREESRITQGEIKNLRGRLLKNFARQLMQGYPANDDEQALRLLAEQLRQQRLVVKFYARHPLHAKLYLAHRADDVAAMVGFVGSSNLTFAGLVKNGELNVDVVEQDAAAKLSAWFEERWQDEWCLDVSDDLAKIIEESWAGGPIAPYHIFIKTAYHLSRDAIEGARQFRLPPEFANKMLDFQVQAVAMAAERLNRQQGVIVGDVVGLGKTRVASAVAKTFQEDHGYNALVVCPPKLQEMWRDYLHEFRIAGEVLSLGKVAELAKKRRYRLVIVEESHNFRNRESRRYGYLRDYIQENGARAILLTATPYNIAFQDIANQLRLFLDPGEDLGIRPDRHIASVGGAARFRAQHPQILVTSLAAFEQSSDLDDWRELMRKFMVRRTRSHIKKNYAKKDKKRGRYYLDLSNGERFYFPNREPRHISFALQKGDQRDQYARLYSEEVVDIIGELELPRYGLKRYLKEEAESVADEKEKRIIENLTRAGPRLRGFLRAMLFKRLESSGVAFLLSVGRHIMRNALMLHAIRTGGEILIGNVDASFDEASTEDDELSDGDNTHGLTLNDFLAEAQRLYEGLQEEWLQQEKSAKTGILRAGLFKESLRRALTKDSEALLRILKLAPRWEAASDRKLQALANLCLKTHGDEKLIIFTQYSDTAKYLAKELERSGIPDLKLVHGESDNINDTIRRFSPRSNNHSSGNLDELRILVATDALSEGQNLQDARIIVNYDLPWAIIRLIQRAGRVDRIGQKADTVYCYSALPEESIELIINLRGRLRARMQQNAELVGSDERFFEDDSAGTVRELFKNRVNLEEEEDETDLISRAYDIWNRAIENDRALREKIERMPDVVYSAKRTDDPNNADSAIAYIKDARDQHLLMQVDAKGQIVSQSQSYLLDRLACDPDTPTEAVAENHHELVEKAATHIRNEAFHLGGQLGGEGNIQNRVFSRLKRAREKALASIASDSMTLASKTLDSRALASKEKDGASLLDTDTLSRAIDQIYQWPLRETARHSFRRQLKFNVSDENLAGMAIYLFEGNNLCQKPKMEDDERPPELKIICSMGLQ